MCSLLAHASQVSTKFHENWAGSFFCNPAYKPTNRAENITSVAEVARK